MKFELGVMHNLTQCVLYLCVRWEYWLLLWPPCRSWGCE